MTPAEIARALAAGDIDAIRAAMDDTTRSTLDAGTMQAAWSEAARELGALRSVEEGVTVEDVLLVHENGEAHLQVAYRDQLIVGLTVRPGPPTGQFGR